MDEPEWRVRMEDLGSGERLDSLPHLPVVQQRERGGVLEGGPVS
jgi:hypothetical protein